MQRKYRAYAPTLNTRPYKMGKSANSQEKGRLLVIPYFLTALLIPAGVALVVASEMGAQP